MSRLASKHRAQYQWYQNTYKTWVYEIPTPHYFSNDTLRVSYSSLYDAWVLWINHHEVGQATTLEEAQALAIMLFKLHPDLRYGDIDPRMPNFK